MEASSANKGMMCLENDRSTVGVSIAGEKFNIKSPADMEHVRSAARVVDEKIREVSGTMSKSAKNKLYVLAALNIASDYLCLKAEYDKLVEILDEIGETG